MKRPRLDNRQVWLLLFIERQCGLTGRTTLSQKHRQIAVPLWRGDLIEIWRRQLPDGQSLGPYFSLTTAGYQLACAILASREQRRRDRVSECVEARPRAIAA